MAKWKQTNCYSCGGYGMKMWGDSEPFECNECNGGGTLWVSEKDRIALWPGGPFKGSWPGEYRERVKATGTDNDWTPPPSIDDQFETLLSEIFWLESALEKIIANPDKEPRWFISTAEEGLAESKKAYKEICR